MAAAKCVSIVDDAVRMSFETNNQTNDLRLSTHRNVNAHQDRPPPLDPKLSTHPLPWQDRFSASVVCISQGNKGYIHIGSGGTRFDARHEDCLFGCNEVLEWSEVGVACESRYSGVVRDLGRRRLEHDYRSRETSFA